MWQGGITQKNSINRQIYQNNKNSLKIVILYGEVDINN